jgi:hemerythrin
MAQELAWSEAFAVGHAGLDEEHRALVAAINAIHRHDDARQPREQLEKLFADLQALVSKHIAHEDEVMRMIVANVNSHESAASVLHHHWLEHLDKHLDEHDRWVADLDAIVKRSLAQGGPAADELQHWFFSHAVKSDAPLKSLFQATRQQYPKLIAQLS